MSVTHLTEWGRIERERDDATRAHRQGMSFDAILGRSLALAEMLRKMRAVCRSARLPVLLEGESGTGKSLVARVLHENSPRASGPFVEVNCAAIPEHLWEAEFFGTVRGAYTHAGDRVGRFAGAHGGTLFLDEIGELAGGQQAKLLRVLDRGCYERLGESQTRWADVRIIAATNRDLSQAMARGEFREDLYYRVGRYGIRVPSLRERRSDIALLSRAILDRECSELGVASLGLSLDAQRELAAREWRGNVRELESVLAQAACEAIEEEVDAIAVEHLAQRSGTGPRDPDWSSAQLCRESTLAEATRSFQRAYLLARLRDADWNVTIAARACGISRSNLYERMRELGVSRPELDDR